MEPEISPALEAQFAELNKIFKKIELSEAKARVRYLKAGGTLNCEQVKKLRKSHRRLSIAEREAIRMHADYCGNCKIDFILLFTRFKRIYGEARCNEVHKFLLEGLSKK
jgi:hypothetical protein